MADDIHSYDFRPMRAEDRTRAYVLVRLMNPDVNQERWEAFVATTQQEGSKTGVTVASLAETVIVGLYTWEVRPSLDHGTILNVDNLIATGPMGPGPLLRELMVHIEEDARAKGCDAIRIMVPYIYTGGENPNDAPDLDQFVARGYEVVKQELRLEVPSGAHAGHDRSSDLRG